MDKEYPIPDLTVRDLDPVGGRLTVSREEDHLLRRFGQVDLVELNAGESISVFRKKADEVWSVISGASTFSLTDRREESPAFENQVEFELLGMNPQAVLVPFGVECLIRSADGAKLVRLTTHQDGTEPGDNVPGEG